MKKPLELSSQVPYSVVVANAKKLAKKQIHDIVDRLNFDMVDFSVIIDSEPYDKNDIIIKIHLFDPEVCRCFNSGRTEVRFVYDKGEPFWM